MPYCTNCGTEITGGRYCGHCGTPVPPSAGTGGDVAGENLGEFRLTERHFAALAYLSVIPAIAFLAVDPYRTKPLIRFHSWQCLLLALAMLVATPVSFLFQVPGVPLGLHSVALHLAWLASAVLAAYKAYHGDTYRLPLIGDLALRLGRMRT